jgi:DNA-binding transcriptional MocR family regulator
MEPIILINEQSKDPIYRQIVEQVRRHVATGALAPGDELPSLRQLAIDLNVHLNTIALAYRTRLAPAPQALVWVREQLERIRTEAILSGIALDEVRRLAEKIFGDPPEMRRPDGEPGTSFCGDHPPGHDHRDRPAQFPAT